MDVRLGIVLLCVLSTSCLCDARKLTDFDISELHINHVEQGREVETSKEALTDNTVCTLCEEFSTQVLEYLAANKTESEIIDILHNTCSEFKSLKQQCITLVDYYAPLFFLEVTSLDPASFCKRVNLCEQVVMSSALREDGCGLCQKTVSEILDKLKDPDTQLDIIELLLKACNSLDKNTKKCKRLVFEYGPVIIANAEKFLETTDICAALHACSSPAVNGKGARISVATLVSES